MLQKTFPAVDALGYFLGPVIGYATSLYPNEVRPPVGAVDAPMPDDVPGKRARWLGGPDWFYEDLPATPPAPEPETPEPPTQFERDQLRYRLRAAAQADLLAYMAADNMARVRAGTWSVGDLTSLMADPAVAAAQAYLSLLSFELAAVAIDSATTPLLTPEIKADWTARLAAHYYLDAGAPEPEPEDGGGA